MLLNLFLPVIRIIPVPWSLLGIVILVLGIAIAVLAEGQFHRAGTSVTPFEVSTTLVTLGLYRFTRNPMYLGSVLILIGVAIICGTLTPFLAPVLFTILIDRKFIIREEKMLASKFGEVWQEYRAKTRRWI
jgi:protein-S-isoprenylcysteine O-methyltransferase Ste14